MRGRAPDPGRLGAALTVAVFQIPPPERKPWPTLGADVAAWQEASLAFGPGDLRGERYTLTAEDRAFLYALYEVNPPDHPGRCRFVRGRCHNGKGTCGRRRFNAATLMLRKGLKKSERGGGLIAVELADDGPVRCDGFRREGSVWIPIGRPITDPYIPVVAFSEKQAEETSFSAAYVMISEGPAADRFDVTLERITRSRGDGKAEALPTSPGSRDGARTTFQVKEETHRWTRPAQLEASTTMSANLSKRPIADPWEIHLTTPYAPGAGSLAESTHAGAIRRSQAPDAGKGSRLFFFYRWADDDLEIYTDDGQPDPDALAEAVEIATGPTELEWADVGSVVNQWALPNADRPYLERVWLARCVKQKGQAFDVRAWNALADDDHGVARNATVALAFTGNRTESAALLACEIDTGYVWPVRIWQRPWDAGPEWEVPETPRGDDVGVAAAVADVFALYRVWRFYVNPDRWEAAAAAWARAYGENRVLSWRPNAWTEMARATRALETAIDTGEVTHPDDPTHALHLGSARRLAIGSYDDDGVPLWIPAREREDSPQAVTAATCSVIVWRARLDALKAGATTPRTLTAF